MTGPAPEDGTDSGVGRRPNANEPESPAPAGVEPSGAEGQGSAREQIGDNGGLPLSRFVLDTWRVKLLAKRPSTARNYSYHVERWIVTLHGKSVTRLSDLELQGSVQAYLNGLPSWSSRMVAAAAIRSILKLVSRTVQADLGHKVAPRSIQAISPEEYRALLEACRTEHEKALITVLFSTGGRAGALCAAKVGDISWPDGSLILRGIHAKNGQESRAPLTDEALAVLHETTEGRAPTDALLMMAHQPRPLNRARLYTTVKALGRRAGIGRPIWPHLFRHTAALRYRAASAQTDTVLNAMGWTDAGQYNRRYGRRTPADTVAEARQIVAALPSVEVVEKPPALAYIPKARVAR